MKPTPIKRKGCVNAGWIKVNGEKVVVKLNPDKQYFKYVTPKMFFPTTQLRSV